MSRSRRYFERDDDSAYRGPSDEMLAVDAATEMRSMTLLYERWADRLYRYFLLSTADPATAERMLRELIARLPEDLQRFAGQDRSFAGWLFSRASEIYWRDYSLTSRVSRRLSRYIPTRDWGGDEPEAAADTVAPVVSGFDEIASALAEVPADRREVLGVHFGAELKTVSASEALRLPASLMSSHIQWAVQALAEQLEATNTRRLSDDLTDLIQRQTLSSNERHRHFSLIHGVFLGEVEVESAEPDRAPIFEIGALVGVVLVGLIGIWVWGLITEGDTRQHEVASPPPAETTASDDDATPTEAADPTPEPTPPAEAAENDVEDEEALAATCIAADGKAHFDRFIRHFNDGDFEQLAEMLPDGDADSAGGDVSPDSASPMSFVRHDGTAIDDPERALEFFQELHESGERWDVLQAYPAEHYRNWQGAAPLEMYQDWKRENPGKSMIIVAGMEWSGDRGTSRVVQGRVQIDCDAERIVDWELQEIPDQQSAQVTSEEFISLMRDLEPGESRTIRARAYAESRPDGGALNVWEITWSEIELPAGGSAERADVLGLDGEELVTYVLEGDRWRVDQRGWLLYGGADDEIPVPDEVSIVVPRFAEAAAILEGFSADLEEVSTIRITEDMTGDELGARGKTLVLSLASGVIRSIEFLEETPNGEHLRPRIEILDVTRSDTFDPNRFDVPSEPRFPELETDAARYELPEDQDDKLGLISMQVGADQGEEHYRISWNDVEMDLSVRPSRGGLDPQSVPQSIDDSWTIAYAEYDWGTLVWAHRHFAGYPTDAIWDDGRYQFIIATSREDVSADDDWDLDELIELANLLSSDSESSADQTSTSPDGGGYGLSRVSVKR